MGILKPMGFDSYAYQVGQFPIASSDLGKIKEGMFCKLNTKQEICVADAGEKGFMVLFPKTTNMSGFAIRNGAFYVGAYTLHIDEECFDKSKTYKALEALYIGADGKLTNDAGVANNPVPVAQVLRPKRTINDKEVLSVTSYVGIV